MHPNLVNTDDQYDFIFVDPPLATIFECEGANRIILLRSKKEGFVGYKLAWDTKINWQNELQLDNECGWIFGPVIIDPEIFKKSFRSLFCTRCKKSMPSTDFHFKVKGPEGPFSEIWTSRDSNCKACRSSRKSLLYRQRKKKNSKARELNSSFLTEPFGCLFGDVKNHLAEILGTSARGLIDAGKL